MLKTPKEIVDDKNKKERNCTEDIENKDTMTRCQHCGIAIGKGLTRCVCGVWVK